MKKYIEPKTVCDLLNPEKGIMDAGQGIFDVMQGTGAATAAPGRYF